QRVNASGVVQWTADGVALCTPMMSQYSPTIVSDGAGGAIVTWWDYRNGYDIYAQRVNASGVVQWTADGVALCAVGWDQCNPTIVSDGAGGAIVTWDDSRSGGGYDIYAQRVNASGVVQWTANGVALCTATGYQYSPTIVSDGAGGAIVTWWDYRSGNNDIYAQRVDANGWAITNADAPAVPVELHQNYPNPFNPATTMTYSISERSNVTLKIYDVSGACIACLVDGQQEKGSYAVQWVGKDEKGNPVTSGIYLYRLTAGNQTISKKMVLLR
ncbi:MAG: T9SS type A sorting domain-containing protein, partial [Candidatus Krumholzibacteriia bacterium]